MLADEKNGEPLGYWSTVNALYHKNFRQSGLVTQFYSGHGPVDTAVLDDALNAFQSRHTLLACRIVEGDNGFWLARGGNSAIRLELRATAAGRTGMAVAEQLMAEGINDALWRVVFVRCNDQPETWHLVMLCHHAICDAQSTTRFLELLLQHYVELIAGKASPIDSLEMSAAPTVLNDAAFAGQAPLNAPDGVTEWPIEELASQEERHCRWIPVPIESGNLALLRAACRRENVSVTNLLTGAVLRASGLGGNARVSTAINLRNRVVPPVGPDGFGCFIGMTSAVIPLAHTLWDSARNCQKWQFHNARRMLLPRLRKPTIETLMNEHIDNGLNNGFFAGGLAISNLGIVSTPKTIGPLRIHELQYTTRQLAGLYSIFLAATTHVDNLYLSISYAEPLMSEYRATLLAAEVAQQLSACCR